ncbi:MAG TPA: DinB family protein [Trueperaceae bacterium]|nr:DinB family protein [Trueperaceae bacterium]
MAQQLPHPWLRGPVDGVPKELQPVAHALIQTVEEVDEFMAGFPDSLLWEPVAGLAPVGFHLKHIAGVIDRLFAQAIVGGVTPEMRRSFEVESTHGLPEGATTSDLVRLVRDAVDRAIGQLRSTDPATLYEHRGVGSKQLPSTVAGMLFHAAEHAQRHCGQLLVTARVLKERAGA